MQQEQPAVAEALATDRAKAAIAAGRAGAVIRIARQAAELTQAQLGARILLSQSAVGRLEHGSSASADVRVLARVAAALCIPPVALGIAGGAPAGSHTVVGDGQEEPMRRRDLIQGLAGIAATLALPTVITSPHPTIRPADVDACRDALNRLYALDSQLGGGHVAAINEKMIGRLQHVMHHATFTRTAHDGLSEVLAGAMENAGWLAYDAGHHDEARRWWLECLHASDVGAHTGVRTVALASMSLQAFTLGRGVEAVQLAQAAARDTSAAPRVRSLLAAREACGQAAAGNRAAALHGFSRAEKLLQPADGDPGWVTFFGPADLASHRVQAAIRLGDLREAERAARAAVGAEDAARWPRNRVLYQARLGRILARCGALDEAIREVTPAVAAAGHMSSARVRDDIAAAVRNIAEHRTYKPAREFGQWAGQMLGASA